ncbi:Inactive carboxylesterase-like protein VdtD [Paramyrothecium foliicola]|nr:Inactive carboxylesterase-like protein VdtD [Paramyrothecium foliicola]
MAAAPAVSVNGCSIVGWAQPASPRQPRALELFYGIPYARAPRFRAAEPLAPQPGRSIAAHKRDAPTQPFPLAPHDTAEDPLTLNIVRPSVAASPDQPRLLPVVVYVHGGAFNFGFPSDRHLASFVAWAGRPILAVGISYRLGALGFLAGDDAARELNLGLKDQRVAVEWLRQWIGAFGGDADDLTLMGVSAGAHAIGHAILHPNPLPFRKAILESGSATARSVLSPSHPRVADQMRSLVANARRRPLAQLPVDDLLDAAVMVWADHSVSVTWPFQPVIDGPGGAVPDLPLNAWYDLTRPLPTEGEGAAAATSGPLVSRASRLAVITGFCSHEGAGFVPQRADTNAEFRRFFATLVPAFSPEDLDAIEALYPDPVTVPTSPYANRPEDSRRGKQFRRLSEAYGHYAYICPVLHTAHRLSQAGARVYLYEYAAVSLPFRAASHGDQAVAVAHDLDALGPSAPGLVAVAKEMNSRWTSFAASPDGDLGDSWPLFNTPFDDDDGGGGDGSLLVFGEGNDEAAKGQKAGTPVRTRTLTTQELEQCRFWWARMELSQGLGVKGVAKIA